MTLDDYIKRHTGKYLEVAGSPGAENQCVDLANGYIRDVLGLPIIEWTNAKDFPSKAGNRYAWIANTPEAVVQKGDIVVWGPNVKGITGSAGHIAIAVSGDVNRFTSFDQNFPTGSPCKLVTHTYTGVTGWLRAYGEQPPQSGGDGEMVQVEKEKFEELVSKSSKYDEIAPKYEELKRQFDENNYSKDRTIENLNQQINDRNNDIAKLNAEVSSLKGQLEACEQKTESYKEQALKLVDATNKLTAAELEIEQLTESRALAWKESDDLRKNTEKRLAERDAEIKRLQDDALAALVAKIVRLVKGGER